MEGKAFGVIEDIAGITSRVIGDSAIEDFLPTLIDFEARTVRVLEGMPGHVDVREAVRSWVVGLNLKSYGVAYRIGSTIRIAAFAEAGPVFAEMTRSDDGWTVTALSESSL